MLIEEGDAISADGRIIFSTDLQVNQSALTGESNPVRKIIILFLIQTRKIWNLKIWFLLELVYQMAVPKLW